MGGKHRPNENPCTYTHIYCKWWSVTDHSGALCSRPTCRWSSSHIRFSWLSMDFILWKSTDNQEPLTLTFAFTHAPPPKKIRACLNTALDAFTTCSCPGWVCRMGAAAGKLWAGCLVWSRVGAGVAGAETVCQKHTRLHLLDCVFGHDNTTGLTMRKRIIKHNDEIFSVESKRG